MFYAKTNIKTLTLCFQLKAKNLLF